MIATLRLFAFAFVTSAVSAQSCEPYPSATSITFAVELPTSVCVAGAQSMGESLFVWSTPDTTGILDWQLSFEALPGQTGRLRLHQINETAGELKLGSELFAVSLDDGESDAVSPPLRLPAGLYGLSVRGPGLLIYRLRIEQAGSRPTAVVSETGVKGRFEVTVEPFEGKFVFPWSISSDDQKQRWNTEVRHNLGSSATFRLRSADGIIAQATTQVGTARLSNIGLPAGEYTFEVTGKDLGSVTFSAYPVGLRMAGHEEEPNESRDTAYSMDPELVMIGNLVGATSQRDKDSLELQLTDEWRERRFDLVLIGPLNRPLQLTLQSESGETIATRDGTGEVRLADLSLLPGRHFLVVQGALDTSESYTLSVQDISVWKPGQEREPNDLVSTPDRLDQNAVVHGRFVGKETDHFEIDASGSLRAWLAEADGEQVSKLVLHDATGQIIDQVERGDTVGPLRLSNLLLVPGKHVLSVGGTSGSYDLKVEPQAKLADLVAKGEEIEPNGNVARAMPLAWSRPRQGWLDRRDDQDVYRFNLAGAQRVLISLVAPKGVDVEAKLVWGEPGADITTLTANGTNDGVAHWDGILRAGDYYVNLASGGQSQAPYTVSLERLPYFEVAPDQEPNDWFSFASELPPSLRIQGNLEVGDIDWYRLPDLSMPTKLILKDRSGDASLTKVELQLVQEDVPVDSAAWHRQTFKKLGQLKEVAGGVGEWQADVPVGGHVYLGIDGAYGFYDLELALETGPVSRLEETNLEIAFDEPVPPFAAFSEVGQSVKTSISLRNLSDMPAVVQLTSHIDDEIWKVDAPNGSISLGSMETKSLPLEIRAPPDLLPDSTVWVSVADLVDGTHVAAELSIETRSGVAPVGPMSPETIPVPFLGGLNLAAVELGGSVQDRYRKLIDGISTPGGVARLKAGDINTDPPTIDLAGIAPALLVGFVFHPGGTSEPSFRLNEVAILTSADGAVFHEVLRAKLSPLAVEQAFVLDVPVLATHIRLLPISDQQNLQSKNQVDLAEFKVVGAPGHKLPPPFVAQGLNLLAPEFGGHIVWSSIESADEEMLSGESADSAIKLSAESDRPIEWVVGFRNNREAQLKDLILMDRVDVPLEERIAATAVWSSTDGPLGPWTRLGDLSVSDGGSSLVFPELISARFLRFVAVPQENQSRVWLPKQIVVHERTVDTDYRSILGEWGGNEPNATSKILVESTGDANAVLTENDSATLPTPLLLGWPQSGTVALGEDEDWFVIEVPGGKPKTKISLGGEGAGAVVLRLLTIDGQLVETESSGGPGNTVYVANLDPGRHLLHLAESPRSVAILWDTSDSVSGYYQAISQAVFSFVQKIETGREEVNLIPFRGVGSEPLLATWSGNPFEVFPKLQNYDWDVSSSNAEAALLSAATELTDRPGAHAVIVLTDAESDGAKLNSDLWREFAAAMPRIFVVAVPTEAEGPKASRARSLMQDWASVNGGRIYSLGGAADVVATFDRIAATLRRPAAFTIDVSYEVPPEPGFLRVVPARGSRPLVAQGSVEVILDASGSMLQHLDGVRRIEIAKSTLTAMVTEVLPPGVPFALRVFGEGPPESCETGLTLPLGPLDPNRSSKLIAVISPTNLAKTPIAESLRLVGEDLAASEGRRLVILLTDGEETCGGDPAKEIAALQNAGFDFRINIVGFAVDDARLLKTFEEWARLGGGIFFEAADANALAEAVRLSMRPEFHVLDDAGQVVAKGIVGGPDIEVLAGRYVVRILDAHPMKNSEVQVKSGVVSTLTLGAQ